MSSNLTRSSAALAKAMLHPASVALVGASDDRNKTAGRPLNYLRQSGFAGRVYPVNPARASVQGERAWASLSELPEVDWVAHVRRELSPVDAGRFFVFGSHDADKVPAGRVLVLPSAW